MDKTTQERIKADAIRTYPIPVKFSDQVACMERRDGYLAGATAENERLQPIIDALDQFISYHESGLLPARHVYEKAVTARKQWRDGKKEVCTCDNIQLAAHGECWGCPGKYTKEK